jgi:hypothetical protein
MDCLGKRRQYAGLSGAQGPVSRSLTGCTLKITKAWGVATIRT